MSSLLRNANLLNATKYVANTNLLIVRHRLRHKSKEPFRKPVWQPIAPSKLYRIKQRPQYSVEEKAQRDHLEYTYEVNKNTIQQFLRDEFYLPTVQKDDSSTATFNDDEEQERLIDENNRENEKIAKMREERLKDLTADMKAEFIRRKMQTDEESKLLGEQLDVIVRREIERSKTYITKDNLDEKIEEALAHKTDYDFAIDVNGKVYFDGALHPYAFTPKAVPETSSNTDEYDTSVKSKKIQLKSKTIF